MRLIVFASAEAPSAALDSLELLGHEIERRTPADASRLAGGDALIIDARTSALPAKNLLIQIAATNDLPRLVLLTAYGFSSVNDSWPAHEFLLDTSEPAELDARLRLAAARAERSQAVTAEPGRFKEAGIEIDEGTYTARVHGTALNLTYKEFELLKFLAASPDRVFTRDQLLTEVWGYDYFGGTRTVDVHVRRLRAKLGSDHEHLIRTVRNVGYLFARRPEG